jgi:hypothetical protein
MLRMASASTLGFLLGVAILLVLHGVRRRREVATHEQAQKPFATARKVGPPHPSPPPRFVPGPFLEGPSVTSDPRSPDYDPVKLSFLTGMSLGTAFSRETRDPLFAPAREQMLRATSEADLASIHATARLEEVECKSSTCKLVFVARSLEEAGWGSILLQYTAAGGAISPGKPYRGADGDVFLTVFVAYEPGQRDHQTWAQLYKKRREENLSRRRSKPTLPGFPPPPPN